MSAGLGLIRRLLDDELAMSFLMENGVTRDAFQGKEKEVFDLIQQHSERYGKNPTVQTIEAECDVRFPSFPEEPVGYWLDKVERRRQTKLILSSTSELTEKAGAGNLVDARQIVRELYLDLTMKQAADKVHLLTDVAQEVLDQHDTRQTNPMMMGVPFGLEYLDAVSDGAQGTDTVAVVGRPGTGKTYFLFKMALSGWLQGYVPLVVSMEMNVYQCARRIIALKSSVPADMIRLGRLSYWGRQQLAVNIQTILEADRPPFHMMQGSLGSTVEDLVLRVQELKPSALYVDGAYLLRTRSKQDGRWERVTYTAEFLKIIATEFNIPVIASYQFNRRGPGSLGNIAFSDAVGQLASIVIGISDENKDDAAGWAKRTYKIVELLKGREGEKGTIRCVYDMERMQIEQDAVLQGGHLQAIATEGGDDSEEESW